MAKPSNKNNRRPAGIGVICLSIDIVFQTILLLLALLTPLTFPPDLPAAAIDLKPLRFAPLPGTSKEHAMGLFSAMLDDLTQALGRRVEFVFTASFDEFFQRFGKGEIDLAYMGALPYITLRDHYPFAEPLVIFRDASGQSQVSCAIAVFGTAPLPLDNAHNYRFALPETLVTCGYMAVEHLLRQHGSSLEHNRFRYIASEEEAILSVVRGDYDASGIRTSVARQFSHLGIRIASETEPLPSIGLVANGQTLPEKDQTAIRHFLTNFDPLKKGKDEAAIWGDTVGHGATAVSDADYDPTRRLWGKLEMNIPAKGNY